MHPALSIVFFTTASGAGFALLLLLGLGAPLGLVPASASFGFAALAFAFLLAVAGLASSAFHLGRPERAWRAFSQWRSSWLSPRECLRVTARTIAIARRRAKHARADRDERPTMPARRRRTAPRLQAPQSRNLHWTAISRAVHRARAKSRGQSRHPMR